MNTENKFEAASSDDVTPPPARPGSRRAILAVLLVIALGIMALALLALRGVHGIYRPSVDEIPNHVDAVVVFGGETARTQLALGLMEDGIADVLVLSLGELDPPGRLHCGQTAPFVVLCPTPEVPNTRGEARMFGRLAEENEWTSLVAVTGDYHAQRARLRLSRCFDGDLAFINVDWGRPQSELVRRETLGYLQAQLLQRGC